MNFKYSSQSSSGQGRPGDFPNLHFVGNKISLRDENRYNPPVEEYTNSAFFHSKQSLNHKKSSSNMYEESRQQQNQQIYLVKRESEREQLSKSSSTDSFYGREKVTFRGNGQYQGQNPQNFSVSANGQFFIDKQMPQHGPPLTRKLSQTIFVPQVTSPTNNKPQAYVQILHHQNVSPLRAQEVITFSPGPTILRSPESIGLSQGYGETSRTKVDSSNNNHVSMFTISSVGVQGGSRVQQQKQQGYGGQVLSNVSNVGMTSNIGHSQLSNLKPDVAFNNTNTNIQKPYTQSTTTQVITRQKVSQNPNSNSQLSYSSSMYNNKPATSRNITNTSGYNYTPLLTKAATQFNQTTNAPTNQPTTSTNQGLNFQDKSINRLQKHSTMNYKTQLNMSTGNGTATSNNRNQNGHVEIKRKSSQKNQKDRSIDCMRGNLSNDDFGFDLKHSNQTEITYLASPKHSKPSIDVQETQSLHQGQKHSSTQGESFLTKRFTSTLTTEYQKMTSQQKRDRKNNLKNIIKTSGVVDKLEEKIHSYEEEISEKNDEIGRLKKDSSEKALEIMSLNRELEKYRNYEKTLSFREREAKSLSFHQPHSDYVGIVPYQDNGAKSSNTSSLKSVQQSSSSYGMISQSPRSSKRPILTQPQQYTSSRQFKTAPSIQNYNHIQQLNQRLLQQIEKMENQLKPLRDLKEQINSYRERQRQLSQQVDRLARQNHEWKVNFNRIQMSNAQLDRTMKLILGEKVQLQKEMGYLESQLKKKSAQLQKQQSYYSREKIQLQKEKSYLQNKVSQLTTDIRTTQSNTDSLKSHLYSKINQLQARNNQLSNQLISKQQYIVYLSQENTTLSQSSSKESHKFITEIEDHKDTINVLKKLNEKQKSLIETEKDRVKQKEGVIARLNEEISIFNGENHRLGQEVTKKEETIREKQREIADLDTTIKEYVLRQNELIGREKQSLSRQKLLQQQLSQHQNSTINFAQQTEQLVKAKQTNYQLATQKKNLQLYIKQLKQQNSNSLNELTSKAKQILQLKKQNKQINQELNQVVAKYQNLQLELKNLNQDNIKLSDELSSISTSSKLSSNNFQEKIRRLKQENTLLNQQISKSQTQNAQLNKELLKLKEINFLLVNQFNTKKHQCEKHQLALKVIEKKQHSLNEQIFRLKDEMSVLIQKESIKTDQIIAKQIDQVNRLTKELSTYQDMCKQLKIELEKSIQYLTQLKSNNHLLLHEKDDKLIQTAKQLSQVTNQLHKRQSLINQTQITITRQEKEIFELKNSNITLTSSLNNLRESQSKDSSDKSILVQQYSEQVKRLQRLLEQKNMEIEQKNTQSEAKNLQIDTYKKRIIEMKEELNRFFNSKDIKVTQLQQENIRMQKELQQQIKLNSTTITQKQKLESIIKHLQENIEQRKSQLQQTKNKNSELQVEIDSLNLSYEEKINSIKLQYDTKHKQQLQALKLDHISAIEAKDKLMEKMQKQLITIKDKIQSSKLEQHKQLNSTQLKLQKLYSENQSLIKKVKQLQKQIAKLKQSNTNSKKATQSQTKNKQHINQLNLTIEQKLKEIAAFKKQLTDFKDMREKVETQNATLKQEKSALLQQKSQLQDNLQAKEKDIQSKESQIKETKEQMENKLKEMKESKENQINQLEELMEKKLKEMEFQIRIIRNDELLKKTQLSLLQQAISQLNEQINTYEQKMIHYEEKASQSLPIITQKEEQASIQKLAVTEQLQISTLQDDKPLSPSTTEQKLPSTNQQQSQQLHQMLLTLKQQVLQLKEKEELVNEREDNLLHREQELEDRKLDLEEKQKALQDRALELEEKEIEVEELYNQVREQVEELRYKFEGLSSSAEKAGNHNEEDIKDNQETIQNQQPSSQLQQQLPTEDQIQFIEIDKNALIYICQRLSIEPVEGQLLTSIIQKIQIIASLISTQKQQQLSEKPNSNKKSSQKNPKLLTLSTSIMKGEKKKLQLSPKSLLQSMEDEQMNESIVVASDDEEFDEVNKLSSLQKSAKRVISPSHKHQFPRNRTLSKQSNTSQHQSVQQNPPMTTSQPITSSQMITRSQIFSQKLIPQLEQQYLQILQLFEVSSQTVNHHELLINEIVSIKETIKMLLEEVKKGETEREMVEKELKEERKRVALIIQDGARDLHKITKEMGRMQEERDNIKLFNAKLQQEILFITQQLITLKINSIIYLNPEKFNEKAEQHIQVIKIFNNHSCESLDEPQQSFVSNSDFNHQNQVVNQKIEKPNSQRKQRKSSMNFVESSTTTLQLPKLKPKVKSQNDMQQKFQQQKYLNQTLQSQPTTPLQQNNLDSTNSVDEQLNMISQINAEERSIYRKIDKQQDIIEQNQDILNSLNTVQLTFNKQHAQPISQGQDKAERSNSSEEEEDQQWQELHQSDIQETQLESPQTDDQLFD